MSTPDTSQIKYPTSDTHRDYAGRPIKPGDYFIYATLSGRSARVACGKVAALVTVPDWKDNPVPKIKAFTVDNGWRDTPTLNKEGKPVTIEKLDRLLVIPAEHLPEQHLLLLEPQNP